MRVARRAIIGLPAVVLLVLSGCSGVPSTSPVERGLEVGAPNYQPIRLQFEAPPVGATPTRIVQGFLAASWSAEDDYAAARAYLTPEASDSWEPKDQLTVYTDASRLDLKASGESVSVTVPVSARVDASGRYLAASAGEVVSASIDLAKVDGEWRIARLPRKFGVWLSRSNFTSAYVPLTLTYADPFDRTLVSDYRWFALGSGFATTLARAQLQAVPTYLRGTAVSGFTRDVDLAVDSVPVVDQVAQVELTAAATSWSPDQRRTAWAQMLRTLKQLPGVSAVSLTVDGAPLQIPGVEGVPTTLESLGFRVNQDAPQSIVQRAGTRLQASDFSGWLRGGDFQRAVPSNLPTVPVTWESLAVSLGLDQVAARSRDRNTLYRWVPSGSGSPAHFASSLTEPAIDVRGRTWVGGVDADNVSRIWWLRPSAPPTTVPTPLETSWLTGTVTAVKPSPGSRRLAVALTDRSGTTSIYVAGVTLGQDGNPVALAEPWRVATGLSDVKDLTWADNVSLAVVADIDGSQDRPIVLPLGGPAEPLAPIAGAKSVLTSGGSRGVIVVTAKGAVWRRVNNAWQSRGQVDELIVPGS